MRWPGWVPEHLTQFENPPLYSIQSPLLLFYSCSPNFLFHLGSPSFFFRVPYFLFPRTFKHVLVPPYFRSFTLFWVDQIYTHSIKLTRLFLLRKYEAQAPESGDGGNRGCDTYIPKHLQLCSTMLATVLVVPHW